MVLKLRGRNDCWKLVWSRKASWRRGSSSMGWGYWWVFHAGMVQGQQTWQHVQGGQGGLFSQRAKAHSEVLGDEARKQEGGYH